MYIWAICPVQDSNMKYWSKLIALHLLTAGDPRWAWLWGEHSFSYTFIFETNAIPPRFSLTMGGTAVGLTKPERNKSFFLKCQLQTKIIPHSGASSPKAFRQACLLSPTAGSLWSTQIPKCYTCRCRCYTCTSTVHLKMLYYDHFQNTCWMLMLSDMCSISSDTGRPAILDVG